MSAGFRRNNLSAIFAESYRRSVENYQCRQDMFMKMHGVRPSGPPNDYTGIQIRGFYEVLPENLKSWSETTALISTMGGLFTFLYRSAFYVIFKVGSLPGRVNLGTQQNALLFLKISAFFGVSFCASLAGVIGAKSLEKRKK